MKITIDNRDLAYTIDTYGMFTGDHVYESEGDGYREEYNLTDDEWRELGFDLDHTAVVKGLADASIDILENALIGNVVKSITIWKTGSPQFYNYTTDYYVAEWDIDTVQLTKYIANRQSRFTTWVLESGWDQDKRREDEEYNLTAMLDFYTRNEFTEDDYNDQMFEAESEIYFANIKLDDESQSLINAKESENESN